MQKSKIEWTDFVWNPIKGLCPIGCWYCYARGIYTRFKLDPTPRLDEWELKAPLRLRSADHRRRVFVCSTFDAFAPVADPWRDQIFSIINRCPDLAFIILTKKPERIDRPMPENVWLGVSVSGSSIRDTLNMETLARVKAPIKFISFEPILADPWLVSMPFRPDWIIAGRLTGHGKQHDPSYRTIQAILKYGKVNDIPVFLKNNLQEIWGVKLIQEFPR